MFKTIVKHNLYKKISIMKKLIIAILTIFAVSFIPVQAANVSQMSSKTTDNLILSEKSTVNTSSLEDRGKPKKKSAKKWWDINSKKAGDQKEIRNQHALTKRPSKICLVFFYVRQPLKSIKKRIANKWCSLSANH